MVAGTRTLHIADAATEVGKEARSAPRDNPPSDGADGLRSARVVFTGRLASLSRREAEGVVRAAGGEVVSSVSRRTNMLVVGMYGWPLLPDGKVSRAVRRAEDLNREGRRIQILSETRFLELAGLHERQPELHKQYDASQICASLGIARQTLERWEQLSLVRSANGRYDFQDLVTLRTIADLIGRGVRPEVINRSLRGLSAILPDTERPLAQLRVVSEHSHALAAELDECLVTADGQLMLNFDAPGKPSPATRRLALEHDSADAWFDHAQQLEDREELEEAAAAYGRAISLRSDFAEAHFNLGNVLRALDDVDGARRHFRAAAKADEKLAEAWYNLADVEEESGAIRKAITALRAALRVRPDYADAHFNLAVCLDRVSDRRAAEQHWRAYVRLDPDSAWGDVARRRLTLGE